MAAGHRPVFIDVDPCFLTIDPQSLECARGKFSAVVAVHLFGQLAEMPAVLAAARGVPVIEDSAHAPLSYWNASMAGSFGVATFYSFASTKYWPAGGGGLAVVNDTKPCAQVGGSGSIAFPTFSIRGVTQCGPSGGKGSCVPPASLWNLRKANAALGRRLGPPRAVPRSTGDPALMGGGCVPPGNALCRREWRCSGQIACNSWHASAMPKTW